LDNQGGREMPRKRYSLDQINHKAREDEDLLSQGQIVQAGERRSEIGISMVYAVCPLDRPMIVQISASVAYLFKIDGDMKGTSGCIF
jgi:hypothetical protein